MSEPDRKSRPFGAKRIFLAVGLILLIAAAVTASRLLLEKIAGIDRRRRRPLFAPQTFTEWFQKNQIQAEGQTTSEPVALFVDTFLNFYQPEIGIAATHLLRTLN